MPTKFSDRNTSFATVRDNAQGANVPMQEYDLLSSEFKRNPLPTFARMRQNGPVVRAKLPLIGPVWLVTTYEAVSRMLRDQETFVRDPANAGKRYMARFQRWMPRRFVALANNMLGRDEPDHRRLRSLVEQAFLRHSVEEMRGRIQTLADEFLDEVARRATRQDGVDLIEHCARPLPLAVICEMLGLPPEDRPRFIRWGRRLTTMSSALGLLKAVPGIWKLHKYLRRQFQICRKQPRAGLMSALVEAEEEGDKLNEEELLAMAFLLLMAGHETTVHLISSGALALLESPQEKAKLMADWSKVAAAVEEVLRYMSPAEFTKPRLASKDVELYGQRLARGDYVLGMLAAANHDPDQFDHPERFDIDRHPNPHLSFGTGIHVCLGLKLARVEAQIALQRLFTRFPQLELAIPSRETQWSRRLGLRALAALPVRLG
jgi:cytochrome P450